VDARRRLLRWSSWFAVANAALLAVIGLRYLWHYAALGPSAAWVYAVLAYVGHLSVLAYMPYLLLVPVIVLLPPRPPRGAGSGGTSERSLPPASWPAISSMPGPRRTPTCP
jgi:membrane-anchored protein YejM (alkaline phosphatase superfamily)